VGDDAFLRWWMRSERQASTPRDMLAAAAVNADVDVRPVLPTIRVPTIVVQARQDRMVPVEHGRYLAANIPGATLFEYDGEHLPMLLGVDRSMDAIEEFVAGSVHRHAADRVLATVLFTDIRGSTERAATLGDHHWRGLLDRHDEVSRVALQRHAGAEVRTTGDGMLSTFDSPARAVRCDLDMIEAARVTGLHIRVGVHTGEIERRGQDLVGIAVHIGARVAALASPGEVLVSGAVPPLWWALVSTSWTTASTNSRAPGSWRLFAVKG
jgi:class 3 adenylate cyclase